MLDISKTQEESVVKRTELYQHLLKQIFDDHNLLKKRNTERTFGEIMNIKNIAKEVFEIESKEIANLIKLINR